MAEARVAVRELNVPPTLEGRDSCRDLFSEVHKGIIRRYYRLRNSLRNGTWPTSTNNLTVVFVITLSLLLGQPEATSSLNQILWDFANLLPFHSSIPRWFQAVCVSFIIGLGFFVVLMAVRQYLLRILLSYRGWLYEQFRSQSVRTVVWAILVKMVSGYQPSLYSCQRSLPRLPVPNLHSTMEKLMESLRPLCTPRETEQLLNEAKEFESGLGKQLQWYLYLKSWWAPNYVSDWWEKYIYLMNRSPLPINSNYYGMDQSYWIPTPIQTVRAATTIYHVLKFKRSIDHEELQPLVIRNTVPICMAQYERIFSTVRIPGEETDELLHFDSHESRHIVVRYRGLYYTFEIFDSRNQILSPLAIQSQLEWIISSATNELAHQKGISEEAAWNISALTGLPRAQWAGIRKSYFSSGMNRDSMTIIDKAIFMVVLSEESPDTLTEKGKWLLHADGKSLWYDKSMNIVYFKNGKAGLNVEHSYADAPAIAHCWEQVMTTEIMEKWYTEDGNCMPTVKSFKQGKFRRPFRLNWEVCLPLSAHILSAVEFAQKNNEDLDLEVCDHDKWGKGIMKKCKVSPDGFIQIALQLAYYKDCGKLAQTYEASMTRLYLCGRTETVRSCTQESSDFVRAMVENSHTKEDKIRLFHRAADKHQQLYRDSMNGKGVDRHLFALFVLCKGMGSKSEFLEKILTRPWTLSTSQQPQQQLLHVPDSNLPLFHNKVSPGGGFGPVSDDGYGVSYMLPSDHKIFFHITSKHSSSRTSSKRFATYIFESLKQIRELFPTDNDNVN